MDLVWQNIPKSTAKKTKNEYFLYDWSVLPEKCWLKSFTSLVRKPTYFFLRFIGPSGLPSLLLRNAVRTEDFFVFARCARYCGAPYLLRWWAFDRPASRKGSYRKR